jgi:glycosyltransferase involved in cell wall biosynthesis
MDEEEQDGVQVHHGPALPLLNSGYFLGIRYPLWMRQLLREMDIIHVHHPFISGRLALRLAHREQPLIFTNQTRYDIYSHYVQRVVPFVPTEAVGERLTRHAARFANRCDAVIAPSASLAQVLQTWGVRTPVEVIPNGIELERFHSAVRKHDPAQKQNPSRGPLAVYLGRLAPEKNCGALLEAFALAHREVPTARLLLIGDGPATEDLQRHTTELGLDSAVQFAGALPYHEVPQALAQCDVFVSASISEVHPLTFIEAMGRRSALRGHALAGRGRYRGGRPQRLAGRSRAAGLRSDAGSCPDRYEGAHSPRRKCARRQSCVRH